MSSRHWASALACSSQSRRSSAVPPVPDRSKCRPSIESGRSMSRRSRIVGATSTRVTKPLRRVTADFSRPGSTPGARRAATVRWSLPVAGYGPTTSTASVAGSTRSSRRPTSSSVRSRAARRWRAAARWWPGPGRRRPGPGRRPRPAPPTRSDPDVVEGGDHLLLVQAAAVRRLGVGLEQVVAHPAAGHQTVAVHEADHRLRA